MKIYLNVEYILAVQNWVAIQEDINKKEGIFESLEEYYLP